MSISINIITNAFLSYFRMIILGGVLLTSVLLAVPHCLESGIVLEATTEQPTTPIPDLESSTSSDYILTISDQDSAVSNQTTLSIPVERSSAKSEIPFNLTTSLTNKSDEYAERIVLDPNDYLGKIITPVTVIIGLTGNTATMIALQGYPFNKIPSRYILSSLTLSDSLALVLNIFNKRFVIDFIGEDVRAIDRNSCKIFVFFAHFAKILSSWFVVLVCCERFVAICLPLHTKRICTKSNAVAGISIITIGAATFSGIWTLSTEKVGGTCNSSYWVAETVVRGKALIYVGSTLIGLLPMAILLVLTPAMCVVLCQNQRTRKELATNRNAEMAKVSAMLISVCIVYIVLLLPLIIAHNLAFGRGESLYASQYLPLMILAKLGDTLSAINFSCNFFLYVACNVAFRRRLVQVCRCPEKEPRSYPESALTMSTITNETLGDVVDNQVSSGTTPPVMVYIPLVACCNNNTNNKNNSGN